MSVKLRVVVSDDDFRRLDLSDGIPDSVENLCNAVRQAFGIEQPFRLQYMDTDFNEFMNLSSVNEIKDKTSIKLIYFSHDAHPSPDNQVEQFLSNTEQVSTLGECAVLSSCLPSAGGDSNDTQTVQTYDAELRVQKWPQKFQIPRFPYDVEVQLQRGNEIFVEAGTYLKISPGLKSAILERLAENIFQFTAYPCESQIDDVAKALVEKYPCLKEKGSVKGYTVWIFSLKYKMANYRTKMRNVGCPEVSLNSLKNKSKDEPHPAKNVKKPRRAEVNFCPPNPTGLTDENLEKLRCEILTDFAQRNTTSVVKEKMSKTFAYRRRIVVQNSPAIQELKVQWPALFQAEEIGAEFRRITTVPLENTFMGQLDKYGPQLLSILQKKGGLPGQKMGKYFRILQETTDVHVKRESILRALCIYLGEDEACLVKEYMGNQREEFLKDLTNITMAICVIKKEGGDFGDYEDIGIVVDGAVILEQIKSVAQACALMLGAIYVLNLAYPKELKYYYEFAQKVLMQMNSDKLSSKVLILKNSVIL